MGWGHVPLKNPYPGMSVKLTVIEYAALYRQPNQITLTNVEIIGRPYEKCLAAKAKLEIRGFIRSSCFAFLARLTL